MSDEDRAEPVRVCGEVEGDLAELALCVLTGEERARVVDHLEGCAACAAALRELAGVADRLVADLPEMDPPPGFESRVLHRIRSVEPRPTRRGDHRLVRAVAIAAIAASAAAAFVVGRASSPSTPAGGIRDAAGAAAPSRSSGLSVALLTSAGRFVGDAYADGGRHPWLLVSIDRLSGDSSVTCDVTGRDGRVVVLGSFWLSSGRGSWVVPVPASLGRLRSALITASGGKVLASATFAA
ncbi:MAG TPA: hypothetical protein VND23_00930 [Acidimicrobiales bacterium]|nr:hypothetical protein [Acidimicrobiales bacterium]